MGILNNIKKKLSDFSFNRREKPSREVIAKNIESAKTVGIVYRADDEEVTDLVRRYVKFLHDYKVKVKTLGFFDEKELPLDVHPKLEFDFFCNKDLNLWLQPQCIVVDNFIEENFDILIDTTVVKDEVLRFVVRSSNASFKVGGAGKVESEDLDLAITLKKGDGIRQLMKGIDHYLHVINRE